MDFAIDIEKEFNAIAPKLMKYCTGKVGVINEIQNNLSRINENNDKFDDYDIDKIQNIQKVFKKMQTIFKACGIDSLNAGLIEVLEKSIDELNVEILQAVNFLNMHDKNIQNHIYTNILRQISPDSNEELQDEDKKPTVITHATTRDLSKIAEEWNKNLELVNNRIKKVESKLEKSILEELENNIGAIKIAIEGELEEVKKTKAEAQEALNATSLEYGIKATARLTNEYGEASDKYRLKARYWLYTAIFFAFTLFAYLQLIPIVTAYFDTKPSNIKIENTKEIVSEQKNNSGQVVKNNGETTITKEVTSTKTYENKKELRDKLDDMAPYATKFSTIALLLTLATFSIKVSLSYRKKAEDYNHKSILAKNLFKGGKVLEGFMGKDKMIEAFAIPTLKQILETPISLNERDDSHNDITAAQKASDIVKNTLDIGKAEK